MMLKTFNSSAKVVIIYGPTATGKTDLALQIAREFQGELISADSRQVYKGLDIGTGKVSFDSIVEKYKSYWIVDGVRINGFDLINPVKQFTVADFLKFTNNSIIRIIEQNKLPIIVGGTGFYIKALIDGIESIGIPADQKLRQELAKLSTTDLFKKLESVDLQKAKSLNPSDRNNPRRLIRAIEIASSASKSATSYKLPATNYLIIGLTAPNQYLYDRADKWLTQRIDNGLIDEVADLMKFGTKFKFLDNIGLEYRWISRYLSGKVSQEQATERLKGDIHDFIRRQKTWLNKLQTIKLFDISKTGWQKKLEKNIKDWYTQVK